MDSGPGANGRTERRCFGTTTGQQLARFPGEWHRFTWSDAAQDGLRYFTVDTNGSDRRLAVWGKSAGLSDASRRACYLVRLSCALCGPAPVGHLSRRSIALLNPGNRTTISSPLVRAWNHLVGRWPDLITTANERFARVWDWESGSEITRSSGKTFTLALPVASHAAGGLSPWLPASRRASANPRLVPPHWRPTAETSEDNYRAAVSPDGRWVAGGDLAGNVTLWDAESGSLVRRLKGHWRWVMDVAWMPDSRHFYSASLDHTVRYWDVETGALLATLTNHVRPVPQARPQCRRAEAGLLRLPAAHVDLGHAATGCFCECERI